MTGELVERRGVFVACREVGEFFRVGVVVVQLAALLALSHSGVS